MSNFLSLTSGWYRDQTRNSCGGASPLYRYGGHGSHNDSGARLWGTEIHGGHDAKGRTVKLLKPNYRYTHIAGLGQVFA